MATTLVFPFTVIALALALFLGDGCAAYFSISLGAKDSKSTQKAVGNTILSSFVIGVILMGLGFLLKKPILNLLGASGYDAITKLYTDNYLTIILVGVPFYIFASATASIIRADGSPRYSMLSTVIGAIINIIFDPIFIFVCKMGVRGAAVATILGQIVSAVMCFIYFRKMKMIKLTKDSFKPDLKVFGKGCKLGTSSFITQIAIAIISVVANNVIGIIGGVIATDAGAALGIVFKVFGIIIAFSIGVSVGAQPIIGYNYGAREYERVLKTIKLVLFINFIIGFIATILFEFAPSIITRIFGNGSDFYKEYAVLSFRIYLGGIMLCCLQKSSCIILQSINKPYKAMILSVLRDVVLLVPGVCILGLCGNLYSMLWAGLIADIGAFIPTIIIVYFESRKLKKLTLNNSIISKENKGKEIDKINNKNFVITIDREFGSGGKYIAQELAKRFNIQCYDNEILTQLADETNIDLSILEFLDEKEKTASWYGFASNIVFDFDSVNSISPEDNLFLKQAKIIENLYNSGSCVIVGRCSDQILKNKQNVYRFFIFSSDKEFKIQRKMKFENTTREETIKNIEKIDLYRSNYYKRFTDKDWGDRNNYELCLDTSKIGVEKTIDLLENYIRK